MSRPVSSLCRAPAVVLAVILLAGIQGCERVAELAGLGLAARAPSVAVIDLTAIAKALGRDERLREQLDNASRQLTQQLSDYSDTLRNQLRDERIKLGQTPSAEQREQLVQLTTQAQHKVQQTQALAQQKARAFQLKLVTEFRDEVRPVAMSVAKQRGLRGIMLAPGMLWFDP